MKIYHKKSLYSALGYFVATLLFVRETLRDGNSLLQAAVCFFLGLYQLYCAMNKQKAKELTIRDSDEMLLQEQLQCFRAAFWVTICLLLLASFVSIRFFDGPISQAVSITTLLTVAAMLLVYAFIAGSQSLQHS